MSGAIRLGLAGLLALGATACVQHTWAPGPGAAEPINMVSGKCKMVGLSTERNDPFFAAGNVRYVAIAGASHAIGQAIGNAVRSQAAYNACMEANGMVAVDPNAKPSPQPAQAAVPQPAPVAQPTPTMLGSTVGRGYGLGENR